MFIKWVSAVIGIFFSHAINKEFNIIPDLTFNPTINGSIETFCGAVVGYSAGVIVVKFLNYYGFFLD